MNIVPSSLRALSAMLLMAFAVPSYAHSIVGATATLTCSSDSLEFTGANLNPSVAYSVHFSFTLTSVIGTQITITGSVPIPAGTAGSFDVTRTDSLPAPLTQTFNMITGTATLFSGSTAGNTVSIVFTSTQIACGGTGSCPATFGFWKHHPFPNAVKTSGLTIGGVTYSASQLLTVLNNPGNGNAVTILGPQLVAALLNIAAGAADNPTADAAISTAKALLSANSLNLRTSVVAPSSPLGQALIAQASILDGYNNGNFHTCQEP